jgi:hypothetical protein
MITIPIIHLYKVHEDENCLLLLSVSRYLHSKGFWVIPETITERLIPSHIILPTITLSSGIVLSGIKSIISFLENRTGIHDVVNKSLEFTKNNPEYRCRT